MRKLLYALGFISTLGQAGMQIDVIKAGQGDLPPKDAIMTVHYTGKLLDGTVFDSSIERDRPFKFELGTGKLVKCW